MKKGSKEKPFNEIHEYSDRVRAIDYMIFAFLDKDVNLFKVGFKKYEYNKKTNTKQWSNRSYYFKNNDVNKSIIKDYYDKYGRKQR